MRIGSIGAVLIGATILVAGGLFPIWPAMRCQEWECTFYQTEIWTALSSYFQPSNEPEAKLAFWSSLGPVALIVLSAAAISGVSFKYLAGRLARPNRKRQAEA